MNIIISSMIGALQPTISGCAAVQTVTEQIGAGASTTTLIPAYGLFDYSWYAAIWENTEFVGGVGDERQITGIEVEVTGYAANYTFLNQTLKLYHVTQSTFNASPPVNLSDLTVSNATTVKENFSFVVATNGWQSINFDTNFCYNGTSNLILVWENRDGSWASGFGNGLYDSALSTNKSAYKFQDTTYPTGTGTRASLRINIKFKY